MAEAPQAVRTGTHESEYAIEMYIGEYSRYLARSNTLSVMTRLTLYLAPVLSNVELERIGKLTERDQIGSTPR